MIRYPILAASLLISVSLSAQSGLPHNAGTFFSFSDYEDIQQRALEDEDLIVLTDGTQLKGKVAKLPQLRFSFGQFPLNMDEVAAIAVSKKGTQTKMQVVTREEYSFVCNVPDEMIELAQSYPSQQNFIHAAKQEIDPHTINYVLLKRRNSDFSPKSYRLFTLELKNGDHHHHTG